MKRLIDITMTAVIRPEVLRKTLRSFCSNLFYDDKYNYRLIINVDPIGEDKDPMKVVGVAQSFFDNVVYNIPKEPSFPKAVMWVWSKISSDMVFHLEDDWIMLRQISLRNMIDLLEEKEELACLNFIRKDLDKKKRISFHGTTYVYKNEYYVSRKPFGFSLNPTLIKAEFIEQVLPNMVTDDNPEKQIRVTNKKMNGILYDWEFGIYAKPFQTKTIYGKNGLEWRISMGLIKPKTKAFLTWVKEESNG
jgi:hypothetical protein